MRTGIYTLTRDGKSFGRTLSVISSAIGGVVAAMSSHASAATWTDPTAVSPTITATVATSYNSTVALKDGDVIKTGATGGFNLSTLINYYVVGTGSTPVTTGIKLSTNPGGTTPNAPNLTGTTVPATLAAIWSNSSNWSGGIPNAIGATADIGTNANTTMIALDKNVTIGSLNFTGGSNDLNILSTNRSNQTIATLTLKTSSGTPTITTSGGKSLFLSDASVAPSSNNGRLIINGNQGVTFDNQNTLGVVPGVAVNNTVGAVKFGFGLDWSGLSGDVTLARGAFAPQGGGTLNNNLSSLPIKNRIVLGSTGAARLELNNTGQPNLRGLDGNSSSSVINVLASGGGPALALGAFSTASDSYDFAGDIGGVTASANSSVMRLVKIGASTQVISGANHLTSTAATAASPFALVSINGGTLSLGTTGTIGAVSGAGQAAIAGAGAAFNNVYVHNGEFKMSGVGNGADRSQTFAGTLVMSTINNNTATTTGDANTSQQSSGANTFTLIADPSYGTKLEFGNVKNRNFGLMLTAGQTNFNGSTALFRGTNLGTAAPGTAGVATVKFTTAPTFGANGYLVGNGSGTIGTTQAAVLRGALADTSATGNGIGFATYDPTVGVRLLAAGEQNTVTDAAGYAGTGTTENVVINNSGSIGITGKTTNTLHITSTLGSGLVTITNSGTGLNAKNGILFSGSDAITLAGTASDTISGTAATDNEDLIIQSVNTGGVTISAPISNPGASSVPGPARQGWITYAGTGDFTLTGAQTAGNSGGMIFNSKGTTNLQATVNAASFMIVNQGTLKLGTGATWTNTPRLQVASTGRVDLNGVAVNFDNLEPAPGAQLVVGANPLTGGEITNTGALVDFTLAGTTAATAAPFAGLISGTLNFVVNKAGATQSIANTMTYSGSTQIKNGTLNVARYGNLPSGTSVTVGSGATNGVLTIGDGNGGTTGIVYQEVAGIFTSGSGTANIIGGAGSVPSVLSVNVASGTNTYGGFLGNSTAPAPGGNGNNLNNLTLRKIGVGTLALSANNNYSGGTYIEAGTLSIASDANLGQVTPFNGGTPSTPVTLIPNNVVLNGGTLKTTASTTINAKRGIGLGPVDGGTGGSGTIEVASGILTLPGSIISAGNTGSNSLAKTGSGTLLVDTTGIIDINGPLTVSAGTLKVNGSIALTTPVIVNGTGRIDGTGTVAAGVQLDGTIAPGNSAGTLNINSAVVMSGSTIMDYELAGNNTTVGSNINDLTTGVTNLTLDGTLNVTALASFATATWFDTWRLINYTGTLVDNGLTLGSLPTLSNPGMIYAIDTATAGQVNLTIVPEPTTLSILGLGAAGILRRRRKTV